MTSTLRRYRPLRDRPVGRSILAEGPICARCPLEATVLDMWCKGCAEDVADHRVSLFVRRRDGACSVCGTERDLTAAHVLSRRHRRIRWDPRNVVAMCWRDHEYLDRHLHKKRAWFREHRRGLLELLEDLKDRAPLPDLAEVITRYRAAA